MLVFTLQLKPIFVLSFTLESDVDYINTNTAEDNFLSLYKSNLTWLMEIVEYV